MIGLAIDGRSDGFFNTPSGFLPAKLNPQVPTHDGDRRRVCVQSAARPLTVVFAGRSPFAHALPACVMLARLSTPIGANEQHRINLLSRRKHIATKMPSEITAGICFLVGLGDLSGLTQ